MPSCLCGENPSQNVGLVAAGDAAVALSRFSQKLSTASWCLLHPICLTRHAEVKVSCCQCWLHVTSSVGMHNIINYLARRLLGKHVREHGQKDSWAGMPEEGHL